MNSTLRQTVSSVSLYELTTPVEIASAQRLRYAVWRAEGAVINDPERETIADSHDDHASHWGVFDGNLLVGAARLCLHSKLHEAPDGTMFTGRGLPTPVASMNRLVVLKTHRGLGIGSRLDQTRIQKAKEWKARAIIIAPASTPERRQSLERQGFHFLEGVIGHPIWSPTVSTCACYLMFGTAEKFHD